MTNWSAALGVNMNPTASQLSFCRQLLDILERRDVSPSRIASGGLVIDLLATTPNIEDILGELGHCAQAHGFNFAIEPRGPLLSFHATPIQKAAVVPGRH